MSLLGGNGLGLPMAVEIEVVDVDITVTKSAEKAILQTMSDDNENHVLVISADSGGCSGYLYDMKIIERPVDRRVPGNKDRWKVHFNTQPRF